MIKYLFNTNLCDRYILVLLKGGFLLPIIGYWHHCFIYIYYKKKKKISIYLIPFPLSQFGKESIEIRIYFLSNKSIQRIHSFQQFIICKE